MEAIMEPLDLSLISYPKDQKAKGKTSFWLMHDDDFLAARWEGIQTYVSYVRALLMTISTKIKTKHRDEDLSEKKMPSGCDTHVLILFSGRADGLTSWKIYWSLGGSDEIMLK